MGDTDRNGVESGNSAVAVDCDDRAGRYRDSAAVHQAVYRGSLDGFIRLKEDV